MTRDQAIKAAVDAIYEATFEWEFPLMGGAAEMVAGAVLDAIGWAPADHSPAGEEE